MKRHKIYQNKWGETFLFDKRITEWRDLAKVFSRFIGVKEIESIDESEKLGARARAHLWAAEWSVPCKWR